VAEMASRLATYRVVLTLQVDSARGSPDSWDWPSRLGLCPPERVVAEVTGPARRTAIRTIREDDPVTRLSGDELRDGYVWNGFDYALQVWVVDGVVQRCGHPAGMSRPTPCCAAFVIAGQRIDQIAGTQRRQDRADAPDHNPRLGPSEADETEAKPHRFLGPPPS
jgi:hypothetical protein